VSQQLETYTEQLLDIIQILQRQRATGVLQVRRGEGITSEEGRIAFANGRTTEARAGRRVGSDAVSWISTWTMCWVRFLSDNPAFSLEKVLRMIGQSSVSNAAQRLDTPATNYTPIPDIRGVSPLRRQRNTADSMHSGDASSNTRTSGSLPPIAIEHVIPTMIVRLDGALHMLEASGLTRAHRQLLLLTDGRRPIGELMRITQRDRDDVYRLLRDLEKIHVIHLIPG
jgi:hypothetical protein